MVSRYPETPLLRTGVERGFVFCDSDEKTG